MSRRSLLRLGLSIALGIAYGLYFQTRDGGVGGWILAAVAAVVALFLSQAFVGPERSTQRQTTERPPTEPARHSEDQQHA
jgi:hypothetical protein